MNTNHPLSSLVLCIMFFLITSLFQHPVALFVSYFLPSAIVWAAHSFVSSLWSPFSHSLSWNVSKRSLVSFAWNTFLFGQSNLCVVFNSFLKIPSTHFPDCEVLFQRQMNAKHGGKTHNMDLNWISFHSESRRPETQRVFQFSGPCEGGFRDTHWRFNGGYWKDEDATSV